MLQTPIQYIFQGKIVETTLGEVLNLSPKTLLYFYPKDDTPGCTLEGQDFTRLQNDFRSQGIQIFGVSKDSIDSHNHFITKCTLGIPLISDDSGDLHQIFSTLGEKNMYGKIIFGVIRSTFLLDSHGNILQEWRNVRATGHAEKVLRSLS